MSTVAEIEDAIAKLPTPQVEELADWLALLRSPPRSAAAIDNWLRHARGAALPGATTAGVLAATRGDA